MTLGAHGVGLRLKLRCAEQDVLEQRSHDDGFARARGRGEGDRLRVVGGGKGARLRQLLVQLGQGVFLKIEQCDLHAISPRLIMKFSR